MRCGICDGWGVVIMETTPQKTQVPRAPRSLDEATRADATGEALDCPSCHGKGFEC